jgi:hypothetical protein
MKKTQDVVDAKSVNQCPKGTDLSFAGTRHRVLGFPTYDKYLKVTRVWLIGQASVYSSDFRDTIPQWAFMSEQASSNVGLLVRPLSIHNYEINRTLLIYKSSLNAKAE